MANYTAEIVSTALGESKEKHTPFVRLQLQTITRLEDNQEIVQGFIADLWLSDKAVERTVKTLRELGFEGQTLADLNYPETMKGLLCEISTEFVEYNGESKEKVKFVNRPGSFASRGLRSCPDDMAKSIASRFDACLRTGKFHKPAQKAPAYGRAIAPAQQEAYPDSADDLPF